VETQQVVERAARDSYGRLLAYLSVRSRDVAAVEDALADAFASALRTWPEKGIPDKPEAWLLTAARRRLIGVARHTKVHSDSIPMLLAAADEAQDLVRTSMTFPDERLKLLFVCAHPAIDPGVRTPLMLQTVLGMDAARIGSAFLVRPSTMGQRLSRAKAKIRDAGIAFRIPEFEELPDRLNAVLEAVYAVYGVGWDDVTGADSTRRGLSTEAIALGRLLLELCPSDPEVLGLLALMLHCEARKDARRSAKGDYIPLSEQDVTFWARRLIDDAEGYLRKASECKRIGRFQLEAAIQSVHADRARVGRTNWPEVVLLYDGLVRLAPSVGAFVGRAAAVAEAQVPSSGWTQLQAIPSELVTSYQPYWALAADLLGRMQRSDEAHAALKRAIGLSEDPAMRAFLTRKLLNPV
jgi:predicted RNA polymerase sigma factor